MSQSPPCGVFGQKRFQLVTLGFIGSFLVTLVWSPFLVTLTSKFLIHVLISLTFILLLTVLVYDNYTWIYYEVLAHIIYGGWEILSSASFKLGIVKSQWHSSKNWESWKEKNQCPNSRQQAESDIFGWHPSSWGESSALLWPLIQILNLFREHPHIQNQKLYWVRYLGILWCSEFST